jgi:hypothetical protein
MNKKLYFSHNWNNKLDQLYFTTIRNHKNSKFDYYRDNLYNKFDVMLNSEVHTTAELIGIEVKQFLNISYGLILIDTGIENKFEQLELFQKFGMVSRESQMIILTFKNQKIT